MVDKKAHFKAMHDAIEAGGDNLYEDLVGQYMAANANEAAAQLTAQDRVLDPSGRATLALDGTTVLLPPSPLDNQVTGRQEPEPEDPAAPGAYGFCEVELKGGKLCGKPARWSATNSAHILRKPGNRSLVELPLGTRFGGPENAGWQLDADPVTGMFGGLPICDDHHDNGRYVSSDWYAKVLEDAQTRETEDLKVVGGPYDHRTAERRCIDLEDLSRGTKRPRLRLLNSFETLVLGDDERLPGFKKYEGEVPKTNATIKF